MGIQSGVDYVDSAVNPTRGCGGCELWNARSGGTCYAAGIHTRFAGTPGYPLPFGKIELVSGRMARAVAWPDLRGTQRRGKPWLDGLPRVIFLGDMTDTFSAGVPVDYLKNEILANVASPAGRRHFWLWFTKRAARLAAFYRSIVAEATWPGNLLPVVSATDQATLNGRMTAMGGLAPPAIGLSLEPLLGPVELPAWVLNRLAWVALGGASGPKAPPMHPDWARSIRDQCQAAGVPFFFKQWGEWHPEPSANWATGKNTYRYGKVAGCSLLRDGRICLKDSVDSPAGIASIADRGAYDAITREHRAERNPCDTLGYQWVQRLGKRAAGRMLDGREWSEMPEAAGSV